MPLTIDSLTGSVFVDEQPATPGQFVGYENCVSVGTTGSVSIYDGTSLAATLCRSAAPAGGESDGGEATPPAGGSTGNGSARLSVYSPPVQEVNPIYYRRSYRTQIRTPGGSVGIRV